MYEIGNSVFYDLEELKCIHIPVDVTQIGVSSLKNCPMLKDVYYGGTAERWQSVEVGANNTRLQSANFHYGEDIPMPVTSSFRGSSYGGYVVIDSYITVDEELLNQVGKVQAHCALFRDGQFVGLKTINLTSGRHFEQFIFQDMVCTDFCIMVTDEEMVPHGFAEKDEIVSK